MTAGTALYGQYQLNDQDIVHLGEARYLVYDDISRLCNDDWVANYLNDPQKRAVHKWRRLAELAGI